MRKYDAIDNIVINLDKLLRPFSYRSGHRPHPSPAHNTHAKELDEKQKKFVIGKMRVNHCGEVCAQALYLGQAITARDPSVRNELHTAAEEEIEHLDWCATHIESLGGRTSILNPLWFIGSFTIGTIAGAFGDKWSLGFLAETELQVSEHLQSHLDSWPKFDEKGIAILEQMKIDELGHAEKANECGAAILPSPWPSLMRFTAKIMTRSSFYI